MRTLILSLLFQSGVPLSDSVLVQEHQHRRADVIPISLSGIEAAALENNAEIRVMKQRVHQAKAGVATSTAFGDPSFMYRGWGTPVLRPWDLNQTQHMFMLSQTFPAAGKRELRFEVANQQIDVAEAELDAIKRDIAARVRVQFYELLRNDDELRLHDEQIALARQAVASARIKYTVGRVPQQDVLKAQVALTKLAEHLVMFLQDGDIARAHLNTLMGRDPSTPLEVAGEYRSVETLPAIATLQQIAIENRPELRAIQAAIQQSETRVRLTQKNYKPDVTVSAGYMLMPSGSANRNGYIAELSFDLPWLNRSKHDAETAEAQATINVQKAELDKQKSAVFQEIQEALIRANSAHRLVELYRDTLRPQAQATLRATSAAYQTDQTDFLNLIDSQNTVLDVEYSYFRALADFDSRIADLERAIGTALSRAPQRPSSSRRFGKANSGANRVETSLYNDRGRALNGRWAVAAARIGMVTEVESQRPGAVYQVSEDLSAIQYQT
jgi:outer membrane protein, heavy metal efflux system